MGSQPKEGDRVQVRLRDPRVYSQPEKFDKQTGVVERVKDQSVNNMTAEGELGPACLVKFDKPLPGAFRGSVMTHFWFAPEELKVELK